MKVTSIHDYRYRYFFCKDDIIVYFPKLFPYDNLIEHLCETLIKKMVKKEPEFYTPEELIEIFDFKAIDEQIEPFGLYSKRSDDKSE